MDREAWVVNREWRLAHGMSDIDVDKEWKNQIEKPIDSKWEKRGNNFCMLPRFVAIPQTV